MSRRVPHPSSDLAGLATAAGQPVTSAALSLATGISALARLALDAFEALNGPVYDDVDAMAAAAHVITTRDLRLVRPAPGMYIGDLSDLRATVTSAAVRDRLRQNVAALRAQLAA